MDRIAAVPPAPTNARGFSLVEMAVVLVIIALLLGGMLLPMTAQQDMRNTAETQRTLTNIQEALTGFAIAKGRFPCPADATLPSGTTGAGLEPDPVVTTGCANLAGVLPWATLGVSETDRWGNRFTYRITRELTRTPPQTTFNGTNCPVIAPQFAGFALCSVGNMNILTTSGGGKLAESLPAVVISHGKNGNGAYTTLGTQLATGSNPDETGNQLTTNGTATATTDFVSKTADNAFDDLVVWVSPHVLFNRMIAAGRLP
jgi:prepilin-type N-terminal cleavage/methylation domain-containing protein